MKPRYNLSIRTLLLTGFCGLSAVGIVLALALGLSTAAKNTSELLTANIENLVDRMSTVVEERLRTIERRSRWVVDRIEEGSVTIDGPISAETELFFHTVLETTPEARGVAILTKDGQFLAWSKGKEGTLVEDWSRDAEVMAWLNSTKVDRAASWGPPIWIDSIDSAAVVYDSPLYDANGFVGYMRYALSISDFSFSLSQLNENAFVLYGRDDVMAHPLMINWRPLSETGLESSKDIYAGRSALIPLAELGDPILEQIWNTEELDFGIGRNSEDSGFNSGSADIGNREFVFLYRTIDDLGAVPLTIGTYIDAQAADAVFDRMGAAAIGGAIVIVIAMLLGLFVARAIGRPIRALASASSMVETGQLDHVPTLPLSHVSELNQAVTSFEGMVRGLAEKEVIRRTLGRYVPESIAEQLMKDDGSLQPTEAEATILFSDIAGFTSLTEKLGPVRIVEVLNAYFSKMTEIIEAEGGVITQFQGDAILAIFNIPIDMPDHGDRACRAAINMNEIAARELFAGERIETRIGINTGPVVAGAVGAEGRLTYTVHGDAVNRAARVEAMNKELDTQILVTEATVAKVTTLAFTKRGAMTVRGQTEPVTVFTPN